MRRRPTPSAIEDLAFARAWDRFAGGRGDATRAAERLAGPSEREPA